MGRFALQASHDDFVGGAARSRATPG